MAMFEGIGIPAEDYGKAIGMLTQEHFLKKVDTNLCAKFVTFLKANKCYNNSNSSFRCKFPRGSKAKTFSSLSKSSYETWIEPMTIPQAASKIEWSDYEVSQGLNHANPLASDATQAAVKDVNRAAALFTAPDANAKSDDAEVVKMAAAAPVKPALFTN
jgi:hypothetical protein